MFRNRSLLMGLDPRKVIKNLNELLEVLPQTCNVFLSKRECFRIGD